MFAWRTVWYDASAVTGEPMMKGLLALSMCGCVVATLLAAPIPKELRKKNNSLNGRWAVESISIGDSDYDGKSGQKWDIDGESLKLEGYDEKSGRSDRLVPCEAGGQRALDWVILEGNTKRTYQGFYDIEGDTFRFCFSLTADTDSRPTAVGKATNVYLYTLKRVEGK